MEKPAPKTFSFVTDYTSIMLNEPCCYTLEEMYGEKTKLLDMTSDELCRQIENCIDWNFIPPKFASLIKSALKS